MIVLNFKDNINAQDMIRIIMKEKNLTEEESVDFAVNEFRYMDVMEKRYADIALDLWGHEDPDREFATINKPILKLDLGERKEKLVKNVSRRFEVDIETAVCYFLIFTMDFLGYHI